MTVCCFEINPDELKLRKKDPLVISFYISSEDDGQLSNQSQDLSFYKDEGGTIVHTSLKTVLQTMLENNYFCLQSGVILKKEVKHVELVKKKLLDCVAYLDTEIAKAN